MQHRLIWTNKQSKVLMPFVVIGSMKCQSDRVTSSAHQRIVPLTGMDPVFASVSSQSGQGEGLATGIDLIWTQPLTGLF